MDTRKQRGWVMAAMAMAATVAFAFPEIPKESAKALGVTRGKPILTGAVFVGGKYIEAPYVVERWGTGIRIVSVSEKTTSQVTGQVINWNEFLKTQTGVKVTKTETAPAETPAPAPVVDTFSDADEGSLDDLFDDNPKPKKKPAFRASAPAKPKTVVSYSLEGEFVKNDESNALVGRINAVRTEIDRILRKGGFMCFGESYSRVTGDERTLKEMLEKLPDLQQQSDDYQAFYAGVRAAKMVYLNEVLCGELFRNRIDYRKLRELRKKLKKKSELEIVRPESLF